MITYRTGGWANFARNCRRIEGSVFPQSLVVSIPNAMITALIVKFLGGSESFENLLVMKNNAIWGGFSMLVCFLVVFRTSQAYSRFWEGCSVMHNMGSEWFNACSSLIAFTRHSGTPESEVLEFKNLLVRLFSMLHAAALGEIEAANTGGVMENTMAFTMELIDCEAICDETMMHLQRSSTRVELVSQWIQQLVVENTTSGVLSIPPPLLSRAFQELAAGSVKFNEAMKISHVPFPLPYAQACDVMLIFHWLLVPVAVFQWLDTWWWAAVFSFVSVFILWSLSLIAVELENPFGTDPNDLDGNCMQLEMNNKLRLLLSDEASSLPRLRTELTKRTETEDLSAQYALSRRAADNRGSLSFQESWEKLDNASSAPVERFSAFSHQCSEQSRERRSIVYNSHQARRSCQPRVGEAPLDPAGKESANTCSWSLGKQNSEMSSPHQHQIDGLCCNSCSLAKTATISSASEPGSLDNDETALAHNLKPSIGTIHHSFASPVLLGRVGENEAVIDAVI